MIKVLELFSGTHSVGKCCKELGWDSLSVDIDGRADINSSILYGLLLHVLHFQHYKIHLKKQNKK